MTGINAGFISPIKSMQRINTTFASGVTTNVTITSVNTAKAVVTMQGFYISDIALDPVTGFAQLTSATNVRFNTNPTTASNNVFVECTVLEYL